MTNKQLQKMYDHYKDICSILTFEMEKKPSKKHIEAVKFIHETIIKMMENKD